MRCNFPLTLSQSGLWQTVGCGRCIPCRIRRREQWATRILLESTEHPNNYFVTLTYDPKYLPKYGSLVKKHCQDWMKRLRHYLPTPVRYFAVGEYGSKTERPHYHAVLFTQENAESLRDALASSWKVGFVTCSELTPARARYAARYTVKKMTTPFSCGLDRAPEFAIMSRRPGLGLSAAERIFRNIETTDAARYIPLLGKSRELDPYLRGKLHGPETKSNTTAESIAAQFAGSVGSLDRAQARPLAYHSEIERRLLAKEREDAAKKEV